MRLYTSALSAKRWTELETRVRKKLQHLKAGTPHAYRRLLNITEPGNETKPKLSMQ